MRTNANYGWLDRFRIAAALLVIAIHTSPLATFHEGADFFLTRVLARVAVPFFFMVTGQFVVSGFVSGEPSPKARARLHRYLAKTSVLYVFCILLYLPIGIYAGHYKGLTTGAALRMLFFDGTFYHLWYFPACILGVLLVYLMSRALGLGAITIVSAVLYVIGLFGDSYYGLIEKVPVLASVYGFLFQISSYTRNGLFLAPLFLVLGAWMAGDGQRQEVGQANEKRLFFSSLSVLSFALMTGEAFLLRHFGLQRHDSMYVALVPVMFFLYRFLLCIPAKSDGLFRAAATWIYMLHPAFIVVVRGLAKPLRMTALLVDNSAVHYLAVSLLSVAAGFVMAWLQGLLKARHRQTATARQQSIPAARRRSRTQPPASDEAWAEESEDADSDQPDFDNAYGNDFNSEYPEEAYEEAYMDEIYSDQVPNLYTEDAEEDLGAEPEDLDAEPEELDSVPEDFDTELEDPDSEPEDFDSEPEDLGSEPEDLGAEPEDPDSEPEDLDAEPEDFDSVPEDLGAEPEDPDSEPENLDSEPEDFGAELEDPDSVPEDLDSVPEDPATAERTAASLHKNSPAYRAWIEVDSQALAHNVDVLRARLPQGCRLMPAVKADGYGHGAVLISGQLNALGVDAFCVASIGEAIELREADIQGEILILGFTPPEDFPLLVRYRLIQTVIDYPYALLLDQAEADIHVHIGIDTGMHRVGIRCEDIDHIRAVYELRHIVIDGLFTHLCASDSPLEEHRAFTRAQVRAFYQVVDVLRGEGYPCPGLHLLASYGIMNLLQGRSALSEGQPQRFAERRIAAAELRLAADYVRPGIALYGVMSTEADTLLRRRELEPVLSLKAKVTSLRPLYAGEGAGYGVAFTAPEDMRIAAVSIGYADGLPRELSHGKGSVLIRGRRAPIIGRICMDQTIVDVSRIPGIRPGDTAVLIGADREEEITVGQLAEQCGTITNEILSRLGARLDRVLV